MRFSARYRLSSDIFNLGFRPYLRDSAFLEQKGAAQKSNPRQMTSYFGLDEYQCLQSVGGGAEKELKGLRDFLYVRDS